MLKLVFENVSMGSPHKNILKLCTFTVPTGHIHAIVGASQSGKSAVLLLAAGQIEPSEGSVFIESAQDERAKKLPQSSKDRISSGPASRLPVGPKFVGLGPIPNYAPLFDTLTVKEQLYFHARLLHQRAARRQVEQLIKEYRLEDVGRMRCKDLDQFSYLRTSLAFARIGHPSFILLDEPDRGLTFDEWEETVHLLRDIADKDCGVIFTTVNQSAANCADSMLLLSTGEVKEVCPSFT